MEKEGTTERHDVALSVSLNPYILRPRCRYGDDFLPRLMIIQHIKRRQRSRESEKD